MTPTGSTPLGAVTINLNLGGSSTFLVNLTRAFRDRGHSLPIVVLSDSNAYQHELAALDSPVTQTSRARVIYEDRLRMAYEELARWQPRAVLACLGAESFEVLRHVPKGVVRLGIIQSHDPGPYQAAKTFAPWIDCVIGVSRTICRTLQESPEFTGRRVEYIPYGIAFSPIVERPARLPNSPIRLVYVGRVVEEQKRISRITELVQLLKQRGVNFRFTIVGSGSELPQMRQALRGVQEMEFAGELPTTSISAVLNEQDVFVLLSDYEGLPLSLLEAMGNGVVPVISDLESGIRDVVNQNNGIRVPIGDVPAAASAIESLANNPAQLSSMSANARLVREEYGAAHMAEHYLRLIDELSIAKVEWSATTQIPAPIGLKPWLYSGLPRIGRRLVKRFIGGAPG